MNFIFHIIKQGDTLFKIAQTFSSTISELARVNNISPNQVLQLGDVILIPASCPDTTNTTRACGQNFRETQTSVASMVFAGKRPEQVFIAPATNFSEAVIAAPLQHHPLEGPLLLTNPNELDPLIQPLLKQLNPSGNGDSQVILVGSIPERVAQAIRALGFTVRRIRGSDAFETAHLILNESMEKEDLILINTDPSRGGQVAASFSAHMGVPMLLTETNVLPLHTRLAIQSISNPHIYMVGIQGAFSQGLINEVRGLGASFVDVISGPDLATLAVNFSRYKSPASDFGWGKDKPDGHAFSFVLPSPWQFLVSSLSFSHRGKHSPFLYVSNNSVPTVTLQYIREVNPRTMDKPPFMHGFIVGNKNVINLPTQIKIHLALSIDSVM